MRRLRGALGAAVIVCLAGGCLSVPGAMAQVAEWTTSQGNPQRTGWQKQEDRITPQTVRHFQLLWKVKTGSPPRALAGLLEPLIAADVATPSGRTSLVLEVGASGDAYALDAHRGAIVWHRQFSWLSDRPAAARFPKGFICEDGLTATPVATPAGAGPRFLYVLTVDGYLHALDLATGAEREPARKMMQRPYAKANGLNLFHGAIYTVTGQGCGGNANSIYELNLATGKTSQFEPQQAGIWGVWGAAIGGDGTIYLETGDGDYNAAAHALATSILAVAPGDLRLVNYYTPRDYLWLTQRDLDLNFTPVVFPFHGRQLLVASGKVGRFYLLDAKNPGGADHQTPLYESPLISNTNINFQTEGSWGGGASWRDGGGARWFLAPIGGLSNPQVHFPITHGPTPDGGVVAFRVEERKGRPVLAPAWKSRDMVTAETPVIAGRVVFELGGGEFTGQANDYGDGLFSAMDRVERSVPAVLYALDATTGRVLWTSGRQVTSFVHQGGMAVANGRVVFGTNDGTVYCFGLK